MKCDPHEFAAAAVNSYKRGFTEGAESQNSEIRKIERAAELRVTQLSDQLRAIATLLRPPQGVRPIIIEAYSREDIHAAWVEWANRYQTAVEQSFIYIRQQAAVVKAKPADPDDVPF